ncbi:MAG TPA: hypothetical protein DIS79_11130, partial [Bacteroidetes bacterium]|nr:hypothetical protein [Bacteroidota bacterium]
VTMVSISSAITLDEIVAKNIEARGGEAAFKKIQTLKANVAMSMAQAGMEMSMAITMKRPQKVRVEIEVMGAKIIQAYDGKSGWSINPMTGSDKPQQMSEEELKDVRENANMDGDFVDYKAKGTKLEYLGTSDVDGTTAYKIKVTKKDGTTKMVYVDAISFLEIKEERSTNMGGQAFDAEFVYGDYRTVDGIQFPMLMETRVQGQTVMSMTWSNVETNTKVEDTLFAMPTSKN